MVAANNIARLTRAPKRARVHLERTELVVVGSAALARAVVWAVLYRDYAPKSDAAQYHALAAEVRAGRGLTSTFPFWYSHATAFRPPLYPAVLGGLELVFGRRLAVDMAFNLFLGCVAALLASRLARHIAGPLAALVTGISVALYSPLIANDLVPLGDTLAIVLILASLLALLTRRDITAGILIGLLLLTRASAQFLPLLFIPWFVYCLGWRKTVRLFAIVAMVLTPWLARNAMLVGSPTIVTSNGFNLAAMYSDVSSQRNDFVDAFLDPALASVRGTRYSEIELDSALAAAGTDQIREDPSELLRVARQNLKFWFERLPGGNKEAEILDGRNIDFRLATLWEFYLVTALGLVGIALAARTRAGVAIAIVVAYTTAASLFTVAPPRLRAPFDIFCCVGVGVVVQRVREWLQHRNDVALPNASPSTADDVRGNAVMAIQATTTAPSNDASVITPTTRQLLAVVFATLAVVAVAFGAVDRHRANARNQVNATIATAQQDIDATQLLFPLDEGATLRILPTDLSRLNDRAGDLLRLGAQLTDADREALLTAGASVRTQARALTALALLTLDPRIGHGNAVALGDLRQKYNQLRGADPLMPSWPELINGTSHRRMHDTVEAARL